MHFSSMFVMLRILEVAWRHIVNYVYNFDELLMQLTRNTKIECRSVKAIFLICLGINKERFDFAGLYETSLVT